MLMLNMRWAITLAVCQATIMPAAASATLDEPETFIATPLGNPGEWITSDDYPPAALKESRDGFVRFRLNVSVAGTVADCTVLVSSGSADLDLATCDLVSKRALFAPARDAANNPQPSTYTSRVRWVIPKLAPPQPTLVTARFVVETDGTVTHCEITKVEGVGKDLPHLGAFPCRRDFSDGYVDAAGKPVRRQVTTTATVTIEDVPEPRPVH